jgi:phosphoribosylglycinamide formyltransferase 1
VRVAVLVSGAGTIMEAMVAAGVPIGVVGADRPCRGIDVAADLGISTVLVDRGDFGGFTPSFDRVAYSAALADVLAGAGTDLVAMAGFGTILTAEFHAAFPGRVLNTHPSLLPAFKGWHAVADALAAGVTETGCTVHVATEELDEGPILAQRAVTVMPGDDPVTLQERIKDVERVLYPATILTVLDRLEQNLPLEGLNEKRAI